MKFVEIALTKYKLYLTEAELVGLLGSNLSLWQEGIMRGKAFTRAKQARERQAKAPRRFPDDGPGIA
ncbi:MAG: hypothetical protein VR69_00180 [Peptococcaceae bacterium BRH_c4b]|nr:MAG: hypothetical protein VR69_00180 [Peptococcaceae bacterium BRH_c4b]